MPKRLVFGFAFHDSTQSLLRSHYTPLFTALLSASTLELFTGASEKVPAAERLAVSDNIPLTLPSAILVLDDSLSPRSALNTTMLRYLRLHAERGCRVVYCALFSASRRPDNLKRVFSNYGLWWTVGGYFRAQNVLVEVERCVCLKTNALAPSYVMDGVYVEVEDEKEIVYRPMVTAHQPLGRMLAAVAWKPVGGNGGAFGYVGDFHGEGPSTAVVLATCGLD